MSRPSQARPRSKPKSSRDKVRAHRARLRRKGLRLVQIWLPDTRSAVFRKQALQESRAIDASRGEKETLDFIVAAADWSER